MRFRWLWRSSKKGLGWLMPVLKAKLLFLETSPFVLDKKWKILWTWTLWGAQNCLGWGFYDDHSILNIIKFQHKTVSVNTDSRVKAEKLHLTMDEALIANSFENEIPTMFAVGGKDTDLNTFPLPAIKRYNSWISHTIEQGLSVAITRGIRETASRCTQIISVWFTAGTPSHKLALGFLHQYERFILKLTSGFMEL